MAFDKPACNASPGTYFQRRLLPGRFAGPKKLPGPGALSNRSILAKTHGATVESHAVIIEDTACQPLYGPFWVIGDFCGGLGSAHGRRTLRNAPSTFKPWNKRGSIWRVRVNLPSGASSRRDCCPVNQAAILFLRLPLLTLLPKSAYCLYVGECGNLSKMLFLLPRTEK